MDETVARKRSSRRTTKKSKNLIPNILLAIIGLFVAIAVGTGISVGFLRTIGYDVNVSRHTTEVQSFTPQLFDSPNGLHHSLETNDKDEWLKIIQSQEESGGYRRDVETYFHFSIPRADGTYETHYVVTWNTKWKTPYKRQS